MSTAPRKIARYKNRKMWDYSNQSYIDLQGIGSLVVAGIDFVVTDKITGLDITIYTKLRVLAELALVGRYPQSSPDGLIKEVFSGIPLLSSEV